MPKDKKVTVLFCVHERTEGRLSCAASGSNALRKYAKEVSADEALGTAKIKVKKSGCLGLCKHGPVIEILPEKIYYRCTSQQDIDQVFAQQISKGKTIDKLLIKTSKSAKKK
jgi:(2Fe-2S) ferredoxin